jgi:hypothetical protein
VAREYLVTNVYSNKESRDDYAKKVQSKLNEIADAGYQIFQIISFGDRDIIIVATRDKESGEISLDELDTNDEQVDLLD